MIHQLQSARLAKAAARASLNIGLDEIDEVFDFTAPTISNIKLRIEQSCGFEQLVLREIELDVLWRLLDGAVAEAHRTAAGSQRTGRLEALRAAVIQTHDLLGEGVVPDIAAARLGEILAET